jgi:serine/threonine-protein kinase
MPSDSAHPLAAAQPGQVIGERYRLEQRLSEGPQGAVWRATDQLAAAAPVVLRQLGPGQNPDRARELWTRLQGVLHPQVPRLGAALSQDDSLWLVREWQSGRTYQELMEARAERQMVFGAGEVLLLLRQLLPVLAVLHGQDLVHGDLCPANLLRRDSDGLPVLLDFGLVVDADAVTPGYAPPERLRVERPEPWMDLHALGVTALVLLSGDPPARLLEPGSLEWRWPACLGDEPELQAVLARLLARDPGQRFGTASQALAALQTLPMPETTGPVPRADRTVALVPPPAPIPKPVAPAPAIESPSSLAGAFDVPASETVAAEHAATARPEPEPSLMQPIIEPVESPRPPLPPSSRLRGEERELAAEGGLWPVVIALLLSAVVGTALGWWWLSRGQAGRSTTPDAALQLPSSLPPAEVDQRQQLLNRLRAMQVDRTWFLKLVDASLMAQFPERGGRLPSDRLEDAPLRKVWNELAEEWLARVEQLPLEIRRRLRGLADQGLSGEVLRQLVSAQAQTLLPGRSGSTMPSEPFRQLWYAAAEQSLAAIQIEPIQARSGEPKVLSAPVSAGGARLFPIRLPDGYRLVLGVNGSPLMQMSVFAADGSLLEASGPLRVVSLPPQPRSPVQLLVTNEGVAPSLITLSLRADAPEPMPERELAPRVPEAANDPADPASQPLRGSPDAEPAVPDQPQAPPPSSPPSPSTDSP